jgi:hypothetical protein
MRSRPCPRQLSADVSAAHPHTARRQRRSPPSGATPARELQDGDTRTRAPHREATQASNASGKRNEWPPRRLRERDRQLPAVRRAWQGPIFVLTHHPEDARPVEDITSLNCPVESKRCGSGSAAKGKNLEVFSPMIGKQLLELGLVDELDIHIAPVLLGAVSGSTTLREASRCTSDLRETSRPSPSTCATARNASQVSDHVLR